MARDLEAELEDAQDEGAFYAGELEASEKKLHKALVALGARQQRRIPVADAPRGTKALARAEARVRAQRFVKARKVERAYTSQLVAVAREVGRLIVGMAPGGKVRSAATLTQLLNSYAEMLTPWAEAVSESMISQVAQRNEAAWAEQGRDIGRELRREIRMTPIGRTFKRLLAENVDLITSLPTQAAKRVHELTVKAMSETGARADEIAKEIMRSGQVTESRARLIARTEVSRTASLLTESRAQHVGSETYVWRTVGDEDVRLEHRKLEGKVIRWATPPVAGTGKGGVPVRYHAGQGPNCRCYPEPILPAIIK